MTDQQLTALKSLAERFNSDLEHTEIVHGGGLGLPDSWIHVVVMRPEEGRLPHLCNTTAIVAGISPEGNVHT